MMKNRVLHVLNNRYAYVLIALFLYILILEDTTLFTLVEYRKEVGDLKSQKEYFEEEIEHTQASIVNLTTDKSALEKFAREQHYMKRDNEDLFVILD